MITNKQKALNFLKFKGLIAEDKKEFVIRRTDGVELCELTELLSEFLGIIFSIEKPTFDLFLLNPLLKPDIFHRRGKTRVNLSVLNQNPNFICDFFKKFYPINSRIIDTNAMDFNIEIEYEGFSPLFDILEEKQEIPLYDLYFEQKNEIKTECINAKKIENV